MRGRKGQTSEGFGVINEEGLVDVRTVSPTQRGAMVNWLVVERQVLIRSTDSDAAIEALFKLVGEGFELVPVWINVQLKVEGGPVKEEGGAVGDPPEWAVPATLAKKGSGKAEPE